MGVTIHYEGKLKTKKDFNDVFRIAKEFSDSNDMEYFEFEVADKLLLRVRDEKNWDYQGLTKGVKILPHANTDPLWLEFDKDNFMQDYCKTQYAGSGIHVKIIELLDLIKPHFVELLVNDEGTYWESRDLSLLEKQFDKIYDLIEDAKRKNPKLSGPYIVDDDRIVDLMERE